VRSVIVYDKRGAHSGLFGLTTLARGSAPPVRRGVPRPGLAAQRGAGVPRARPERIGFATSAGSWLYTTKVAYREDLHHAARLLLLSRPNGREPTAEENAAVARAGERGARAGGRSAAAGRRRRQGER
jgi:hypothetical protein